MLPVLSMSLGAGETTLLRMVSAYSMLANGGRRVKPTVIDRVQDRWGHTIFRHDERQCVGCDAAKWENQKEPRLVDKREQILDPLTAAQITSMMEGVVQRGTATVVKEVGKRLAGKTGTTNESKDVWFVGYSPDLTVGVFMGYDRPRSLGDSATAGQYAAPIFRDFMKLALKDKPDTPFRVPPGAKLISVDAKTGLRSSGSGAFLEVFKPGTAPPDSYTVIGATSGESGGGGGGRSSSGGGAGSTDTGGLY
jgi:penicillin-binding protein 1A